MSEPGDRANAADDHAAGGEPDVDAGEPELANASRRQLVKNFVAGYLGIPIGILSALIVTPIILRNLGETEFGLWILLISVGSLMGIFDAGVANATVQQIAAATALRDNQRRADILSSARAFFVVSAIIAVLATIVVAPFIAILFKVPPDDVDMARVGLVVMGTVTAVGFLASVPSAMIHGSGRGDRLIAITVLTSILVVVGQLLVVLLGGGVVPLLSVALLGGLIGYFAMSRVARRLSARDAGGKKGRVSRSIVKELLTLGWRNLGISLGGSISYGYNSMIIGAILPVSQVAPYSLASSTANFARTLSTAGTNLLVPTYAHSSALADKERQFRLYSKAILYSSAINLPIVVSFIAFGPELLQLWLGSVPDQTYEIVAVLNLLMLLQLPGHQSVILLTGIARTKTLARVYVPVALINLTLSVYFTFQFGPIGPVLGSFPQVLLFEFLALPLYCCRCLNVRYRRYLKESVGPLLLPVVASGTVAVLLLWRFEGNGIWSVVESAVVAGAALGSFALMMWKSEPMIRKLVGRA